MDAPDQQLDTALLRHALDAMNDGVVIADATLPDNPLVYVNPAFERLTGYGAEDVLGQNCRFLQGGDRNQAALAELRAALKSGEACRVTLRNFRRDGSMFWNELSISPVRDAQGRTTHYIGVQKDVTERIYAEQTLAECREDLARALRQLELLSLHDTTTGVLNRRCFDQRFETEWRRAIREGNTIVLLLIRPDRFNNYRRENGVEEADHVLRRLARAVQGTFRRASDAVARFEHDTFAALATGHPAEEVQLLADIVCSYVREMRIPHVPGGMQAMVTVSVGAALTTPTVSRDACDLIAIADGALAHAAHEGGDRAEVREVLD